MTIETPILRVINILSEAQEKCPANLSLRIEEALEILRSPDLYAPPIPPSLVSSSSSSSAHQQQQQQLLLQQQQQQQQQEPGSTSSASNVAISSSASNTHPNINQLTRGSSLTSTINTGNTGNNLTCITGSTMSATGLISSQYSRQESDADEITTDLFTGLIHSNKPISGIRRMSYEAAVAHRQSFSSLRDFSPPVPSPGLSSGPISLLNPPECIKAVLEHQLTWDFDAIKLEQLTSRKPLVWLGLSIASHFNVYATLNCDEGTFRSWLSLIESNYRNNPYHNSTHAADVMQATAYFLTKPRIESLFDPLDEAISLIAAICHDIDHPGKTSAFLCNSGSDLAILYNDISVLESHHAALTFKLTLSDPSVNIFKNLDKDTFKEVRSSIIDMILATEMTKHFEHLTKFVNIFTQAQTNLSVGSNLNEPSDSLGSSGGSSTIGAVSCSSLDGKKNIRSSSLSTPENIVLVKRMLIKCADVSNPTRPLHLCIVWANRIAEEYCNQTDEEKAQGLPVVMPVFDRATCSIPKSQMGFIDFFANDMFQAWDSFGDFPELIDLLKSNYSYWQGQQRVRESSLSSTTSTASAPAVIQSNFTPSTTTASSASTAGPTAVHPNTEAPCSSSSSSSSSSSNTCTTTATTTTDATATSTTANVATTTNVPTRGPSCDVVSATSSSSSSSTATSPPRADVVNESTILTPQNISSSNVTQLGQCSYCKSDDHSFDGKSCKASVVTCNKLSSKPACSSSSFHPTASASPSTASTSSSSTSSVRPSITTASPLILSRSQVSNDPLCNVAGGSSSASSTLTTTTTGSTCTSSPSTSKSTKKLYSNQGIESDVSSTSHPSFSSSSASTVVMSSSCKVKCHDLESITVNVDDDGDTGDVGSDDVDGHGQISSKSNYEQKFKQQQQKQTGKSSSSSSASPNISTSFGSRIKHFQSKNSTSTTSKSSNIITNTNTASSTASSTDEKPR